MQRGKKRSNIDAVIGGYVRHTDQSQQQYASFYYRAAWNADAV